MKIYYKLYFLLLIGLFGVMSCSKKDSGPKTVEVSVYGGSTEYDSMLYVDGVKYDYLTPLPYVPECGDEFLVKVKLTVGDHVCKAPNNSGNASGEQLKFTVKDKSCQIVKVPD
jgi:hypothetical protein